MVASERQIAANRRNAGNSTGPRSSGGRKRASRNSYRHGLTATMASSAKLAKAVERLARKIADDTTNPLTLEYARAAAQAEFDLARVRQAKVAVIERMLALGEFDGPRAGITEPVEAEAMPPEELERLGEAVRRALPELANLDRYERRAAVRRDRSLIAIYGTEKYNC